MERSEIEKNFVDDRNRELFNSVFDCLEVEFEKSKGGWEFEPIPSKSNAVKFRYDFSDRQIEGFTHELLHASLMLNGFQYVKAMGAADKKDDFVYYLFNYRSLNSEIINVFAHQRMFPIFIELGFSPESFTRDNKPDVQFLMQRINESFDNPIFEGNRSISCFFRCFYEVKDNRKPKYDAAHRELENFLRSKDKDLFDLLERNWNAWIAEGNDLLTVLNDLLDQTSLWWNARW
ncbi:MAG: hypothetical protein GC178_07835 [Flavobacteriales bacterium]|nr:hypothetical protein [Flavobacteriales bacterium]